MAITDDQLNALVRYAERAGSEGLLENPDEEEIVAYVFEWAATKDMRTDDEFNAVISPLDMAASEDRNDIVAAWQEGQRAYNHQNKD